MVDIAVAGGGASGLLAAISAAERLKDGSLILLEKNDRVGKKLLATGNGRCNLSNRSAGEEGYNQSGQGLAREIIRRFSPEETMRYFSALGIECWEEDEGRRYPLSEQASSVLEMLRARAAVLGVKERCGFCVEEITGKSGGFVLKSGREALTARRVILASGGCAAPHLGGEAAGLGICKKLGIPSTALFPSLVAVKTDPARTKPLKGLKSRAALTLLADGVPIQSERGEVLFTEYGLSGVCVFQLSRAASQWCATGKIATRSVKKAELSVDLLPGFSRLQSDELLRQRRDSLKALPMEAFFTGLFNKRVGQALLKETVQDPFKRQVADLSQQELAALQGRCRAWRFPITGVLGWNQAQVMAGGIPVTEVTEELESRKIPGLYLCGELLDVDGRCGGYNLQWAWSSGRRAGLCAAQSLQGKGEKHVENF